MRLASNAMICFDGRITQPVVGKGIDLYQAGLISYYAMLRLRGELASTEAATPPAGPHRRKRRIRTPEPGGITS